MLFRELAEISYKNYCASGDAAYLDRLRSLPIDRDSLLLFASSRLSQKTLDILAYKLLPELYQNQNIQQIADDLDTELKLQGLSSTNKIALLTAYHSLQETMAIMPFYLRRDEKVEDIVREVNISRMMLAYNKALVLLSNNETFPEDDIEYQLAERLAYQISPGLMQSLAYTNDINKWQQVCVLFSLSIVQANSLMPSLLRAKEMSKVLLITEGLSKIQVVQDEPQQNNRQYSSCFMANAMSRVANIVFDACTNCYKVIKICLETLIDAVDKYILSPVASFAQEVMR